MSVSLHLALSFADAWESVLLPWFETATPAARENRAPVAVVTPYRSHAQLLRKKLLEQGISLLGVRFFTPPQLREVLQGSHTPAAPLREHLRLFLSVAANRCAVDFETAGNTEAARIARAVARDPDALLRAIDDAASAGATFAELTSPALGEIARRFEEILKRSNCALVSETDRRLLEGAGASEQFSRLLISGFDAAHWPLWPLLRAAAQSAQNATVILRQPRDQAAELDRVWISTWEEAFGPARQLPPPVAESGFERLLTFPETLAEVEARQKNPAPDVHFAIGHDSAEQARAVVAMAVAFLNEPSCERLAILLPGPGAVARLVADGLKRLGIPHNDGVAHPLRGPLDDEEWRAWLELQEQPRLAPLLRFLSQSREASSFFAPLSFRGIQETLQRAFGDILIDAVDVLREYCRSHPDDDKYAAALSGLEAIQFLPPHATFHQFAQETNRIFRQLKWTEREAELKRFSSGWSANFSDEFPREFFLRWMREIFADSSLLRDPEGDHSYARVQLLPYEHAESEVWSHAIFAGLNEGVWPPSQDESPFLPDAAIAALNRRNQQESHRFGEGQRVAREGAALCMSAGERRALALQKLLNVIDRTMHGIGVAAERHAQRPREQAVNPSDFFARLYFSACGRVLSQREIDMLHARTRDWLADCEFLKPADADDGQLKQTVIAYRARREPGAFGEYEFAFRKGSPPARSICLSATDIASMLQRPALVWMKHFLGVRPEEENRGSWDLATGLWVHGWMATIGSLNENQFVPKPSAEETVKRVTDAADAFRAKVVAIIQRCGRNREPDWWHSGWLNARHLAEQFARQLAAVQDWAQLSTEWKLDSPHVIQLDNDHQIYVRGRVDLILARDPDSEEIWIVDYKTGQADPLKSSSEELRKQLIAGNGVQLCVYALALSRDFRNIQASLLTREGALSPQVALNEILRQHEIWKEIARMQRTGIFGMLGEIRSEFTFTGTYPLATLAIDKELLKEKWRLTHPAFAPEKIE